MSSRASARDPLPTGDDALRRQGIPRVAETVAYGTQCIDDATFLHRAFTTLLEREPNEAERRELLARLRRGETRREIARRIARSDDFLRE